MTDAERWQRWLTGTHPMADLTRWARGLHAFRFCRAVGGHSGIDGDTFLAAVRYRGEADLLAVFDALGIAPERVPLDVPQPVPGQPYTGDEMAAFPSLIPGYPTLRQPGHVRLAGESAFVWAGAGRVEISVADAVERWDVTEAAFRSAQRIEPLLAPLADRVVDPPRADRHCLCPAYYPEVWAAG